jgi:hypothetical protein
MHNVSLHFPFFPEKTPQDSNLLSLTLLIVRNKSKDTFFSEIESQNTTCVQIYREVSERED